MVGIVSANFLPTLPAADTQQWSKTLNWFLHKLPVSDGSFTNLAKAQPWDGVAVPGPAPAFPSIALASEVNRTSVPSTAAAAPATAPVGAVYGTPGPSSAPGLARAGAPAPQG